MKSPAAIVPRAGVLIVRGCDPQTTAEAGDCGVVAIPMTHALVCFRRAVEKSVGGEQGGEQRFHAATACAISAMGLLQHGGVVERFITSHPKAERVPDKDLLGALAGRKFLDQFQRAGNFPVELRVTRIDDLASRVDWAAEFRRPVQAGVVELFKR